MKGIRTICFSLTLGAASGRHWKPFVVALMLTIFVPRPGSAAISLIYPPPNSSVDISQHLIIKFNSNDISGAKVTVNGLASDLLPVGTAEYRRFFQDFLILQPVWDRGRNEVVIDSFVDGKKAESLKATIFYVPKGSDLTAPKEFVAARLHLPETEKLCQPCHNMHPTAAQMSSSLDKDNPCYGCHKRMVNHKYVHGPTGTFSCAYCHSLQGEPRYSTPKRDTALCYECHVEQAKKFAKYKYQHGPVAAGMCEICHDPHGSENPAQLKMPINKLCLSCHEHVAKGPHVTRMPSGEGHPVDGRPDPSPRGAGRTLSCISCHNPHGADVRYYFQNNADDRMMLCQMCHQK